MFSLKILDRVRWIVRREYGELTPSEKRTAGKLVERGLVTVVDGTVCITDWLRDELREAVAEGWISGETLDAATEILFEDALQ